MVAPLAFLVRRWRLRRMLRAWARGELEFAGALGSGTTRRRRVQLLLR
jgi:hypothetical protein